MIKSPDGEAYFPDGKGGSETCYRAALLPSMLHKREEKGSVRFRLAIFSSFSKPIFLTYSRGGGGASIEITRLQLYWVRETLEFAGFDKTLEPAGIELSGKVVLGNRIANILEEEVMKPRVRTPLSYLTKEQRQMAQGLDGTRYVIEVSTDVDYTVNRIWTPEVLINQMQLLKVLKQQEVDVESMVDELMKFIDFRDHLLDLVGIQEPRYSISHLLEGGNVDANLDFKDGRIIGLPKKYSPASFDLKKLSLSIGGKKLVFPNSLRELLMYDASDDPFSDEPPQMKPHPYTYTFEATWGHLPKDTPPYIAITVRPKNKNVVYKLLIDMDKLELIYADVIVEGIGRVPIALDRLAFGRPPNDLERLPNNPKKQ